VKIQSAGWRVVLLAWCLLSVPLASGQDKAVWWSAEVAQALERAGTNKDELVKALNGIPADQRKGMAFLIANMPDRDLRGLRADFLLENVALAYKARQELPWGRQIPEDIFLNDVLPYANVDEARDPWRKELYELCLPLVKECKTPGEAAHRLNSTIFGKLNARYSTERKKPNQSPKETIAQGKATCSGLSILLSDACRSVGVPARLVGTPLWANKRGNHTWVEVWDDGWHFAGAAEPDPKGLDHGWFVGDAAQAKSDPPEHGIYAASFRKTKVVFPLVWAPDSKEVFAENVTARYAKEVKLAEGRTQVLIRVWEPGKVKRLALPVVVSDRDKPEMVCRGDARGDTADTNDILTLELLANRDYIVRVGKPVRVEKTFHTGTGKQQIIDIEVPAEQPKGAPAGPGLTPEQAQQVEKAALAWFSASEEERAKLQFGADLDALLAKQDKAVRQAVWKAYLAAPVPADIKKDFEEGRVRFKEHVSPYKVRKVGTRPANGWPLVIAMHGGGNAPQELNDSQWKIMETYYKDQTVVPGYLYVALRAPNNTWNGFYDTYVPPLIINLIRQFTLLGEVDPDKVFLIGYSHGGYGAFYIGPKIPDRFAAFHSSAAAPTDGTISALNLRNTRFTFMVGDKDTAYGRRERCEKFGDVIRKLKEDNKGEFPVELELKTGFGHGGLPDRDKLKEMLPFVRQITPGHLTWEPMDNVLTDFFWLSVDHPEKGQQFDAQVKGNTITVTTHNVKQFDLLLDSRLVNLDKPVTIVVDGKTQEKTLRPSFLTLCQSMARRGDPALACTCQVRLEPGKE
jgi:transglutaminase-like putative cysteine protease/predicted esterase